MLAGADNFLLGFGYPNGSTGGLVQEGYWVALGPLAPGQYTLEFGALGSNGNGLYGAIDTINVMVPEPSTWAMMFVGFAGIAFASWRRSGAPRAIAA